MKDQTNDYSLNPFRIYVLLILLKMGNRYCCFEQKNTVKRVRIAEIITTTSIQARISIFQDIFLQAEFRNNYQKPLEMFLSTQYDPELCFSIFNVHILSKIGKGAYSDVYLVRTDFQTNQKQVAMKVIPKQKISTSSLRKSLAMQNLLMHHHTSPFLLKTFMSHENESNVFFFVPFAPGGDLLSFAQELTLKGSEFHQNLQQNIKFVVAGIVLGLEYLHHIGIIWNDLKMENILIDQDGYPLLSDFGLIQSEKTQYFDDFVGTVVYLSPQKVLKHTYTKSVDFWALGVLIYTLIYNDYPFAQEIIQNQKRFVQEVTLKERKHKKMSLKSSQNLNDLINQLLLKNPEERIGVKNIQNLKNHKFFEGFNWSEYALHTLESPLQKMVVKYPLKGDFNINIPNIKVFRGEDVKDQFLFDLDPYQKQSKSLCKTKDQFSSEDSSYQIENSVNVRLFSFGNNFDYNQ